MNSSQTFDFNSLKKETVDGLLSNCKVYVEKYLSADAARKLDKAYKESKFDVVKNILKKTLKRMKTKIKVSEYQKAEKAVLDEFPDAAKLFVSDNDEGSQTMGTGSGMIAVIVIIVAIIVFAIIISIYSKRNNKTVGEVLSLSVEKVLSFFKGKGNSAKNAYSYTDKDRDLMSLIHELSAVYENTDKYLNS